jgi:hypothetical protein
VAQVNDRSEEEGKMPYISSYERFAEEKAEEKAQRRMKAMLDQAAQRAEQGERTVLLQAITFGLDVRFHDRSLVPSLEQKPTEIIRAAFDALRSGRDLDDLRKMLA